MNITKEQAIELAKEVNKTVPAYPDTHPAYLLYEDTIHRLRNLAIEHAAKDVEPIGFVADINGGVNIASRPPTPTILWTRAPEIGDKLYTCPARDDIPEAIQLLSDVFDAWENGTQCNEEDGSYIGTAFRLDDTVFHRCCDLLNRVNPPRNAPAHDDTALLRQALEALEHQLMQIGEGAGCDHEIGICFCLELKTITALRERLGEVK